MNTLTVSTITVLLLVLTGAQAHSDLGYPEPYNTACKGDQPCIRQACPKIGWKSKYTPERPFATWRRGQQVEIIWHKNNHNGGFYRRSLVPVKYMSSHEWHEKTAFEYGCWSQGTFKCGTRKVCGKDFKGLAYKNKMIVPDVFPDGVYAFAQVWYGGVDWRLTSPKYSDYYACSFIRIQGGAPLRSSYTAKFVPSPIKKKGVPLGVCRTGAVRTRECGGGECSHKKVKFTVPQQFQNNRTPPPVLASLFGAKGQARPNDGVIRESASEEKKNMEQEKKDAAEDAKDVRDMSKAGKVEEHPDNPLLAFKITIGGRTTTLMEGEFKSISVRGTPTVDITVDTGDKRPSPVFMKVPGARNTKTERVKPYEFPWKVLPGTHTLTARTGPYTLTARLRVQSTGGQTGNNKSGCSLSQIPPRTTGPWGVRDSPQWLRQRGIWYKRWNYCKRCNYRCAM